MRTLNQAAFAAIIMLAMVADADAAGQIAFSDQTVAAGVSHTSSVPPDVSANGMFAGGAVGDFNRDGWPDLFLLGGGDSADALFINNGNGTFTDEATSWGLGPNHRGQGATVGDYNDDGWPDLYVTSAGVVSSPPQTGQHRLYRNNGNSTFTDVAVAAGVNEASPTHFAGNGAAFGDYDLDGDLDLFVCNWDGFNGNILFRNNGNETFTDVTAAAGIDQAYWGFSPRFVDMDGDRYPELLIVADDLTSRYFVNNQDGTFTDATQTSGTGLDQNGMGTTLADFNRDGLADWFVTSIYDPPFSLWGNYLYVNQGNHVFSALPESAGAKNGGWGWGVDAVDIDHDGWTDLVETNGWTNSYDLIPAYLYRNNGDLTFTEVHTGTGFDHTGQGRGLLSFDYDRDGDMDIVITANSEPVTLFRNDLSGTDINWIQVVLDTGADPGLCPDGYGARVIATTSTATQYHWVTGGTTYIGRSELVAHFGLGDATTVDVTVEWSDGSSTTIAGVPVNQRITVAPAIAGAPGEAAHDGGPSTLMRASRNEGTGEIDVLYGPSCDASDHTIYYGDLADVSSYNYSGATCLRGTTGSTSFAPVGLDSAFFLIVGNTGAVEGSYGVDGASAERPEDLLTVSCDLPQDLTGTCVP